MIHYHGTPLGGRTVDKPRFLIGRHALVSFHRPDDMEDVAACCQSFALDNGAFSAWRSGEAIVDWTPYYEFARKWMRHPGCDWVIIPDVIDGSESENDKQIDKWLTWSGWQCKANDIDTWYLESRSVPVWHLHESFTRLISLAKSWQRIAFGSSGKFTQVGTERWWDRVREAFDVICVNSQPICKIHGLRMLDSEVFPHLPFASADSCNVARNYSDESRRHRVSTALAREMIAERAEVLNSSAFLVLPPKQLALPLELRSTEESQTCQSKS